MPGRALIFDPMITHRIMLKAQLSQDFFAVSLASDDKEFFDTLRHNPPDVVLMSYTSERDAGFKNLYKLRNDPTRTYLPVVFLHGGRDLHIWDQSHDCLADDVLAYTADRWLMNARLNLLIRSKEKIDSVVARQRTISDMGFAEESLPFPPPLAQGVILDLSHALCSFNSDYQNKLTTLLRRDFPMLDLRLSSPSVNDARPPDVILIDQHTQNCETGLAALAEMRKTATKSGTQALYLANHKGAEIAAKAIELGARDFTIGLPSVAELACRLRRLIWLRHMELRAERAVSQHLKSALTDSMTGLYNRRYALQYLTRLLARPAASDKNVTVMVLDLDRFKSINDSHGHLVGDTVIRETAARLLKNLRSADLVARIGGEEFLIVLSDTAYPIVRDIAERLRSEIASIPYECEHGVKVAVSASIGVSALRDRWICPTDLIESADTALYKAKGTGRNRVTFSGCAA